MNVKCKILLIIVTRECISVGGTTCIIAHNFYDINNYQKIRFTLIYIIL